MRHILNGIEITPENVKEIGLVLNYGDESEVLSLTTDSVTLVNEADAIVRQWVSDGFACERIPYQLITESNPPQTLEYGLSVKGAIFKNDKIEGCRLVKRRSNETFMQQADGLTFTSLAKKGVIFPTIDTPYIIVKDDQVAQGITLALTIWSMEQALAQAFKDTLMLVKEFVSAIGLDLSDIIAAGLALVAQLIYTVALIVALIKLAQKLKELLFPKIRYLKVCKIRDLIKVGIEQMTEAGINCGYTLSSTLLNSISNEYILPVPLIKGKKSIFDYLQNDLNFAFNYGYPTSQDTTPTLGSLIRSVETKENARTTIVNGIVRIERRDFVFNQFEGLNPALAIQGERTDGYQLNLSENFKRAYYHYLTDSIDLHTLNEFEKTDCEDSTEPIIVNNADLVDIEGFKDLPIPFALGSRKNKLNNIENVVLNVFQKIDALTSILGVGTSFSTLVTDRIGVLQISEQFFSTTKLLYLINKKQPLNYLDFIGARQKYNHNYLIDFIGNNDYIVREQVKCVIDSNDFVTLQQSNYAEIDGKNCELTRVEFYDQFSRADVTYKEPYDWAANLKRIEIDG